MGKTILLILGSLAAQVHADAEDQLANNMGMRATSWTVFATDLDDSTLGKAKKDEEDSGPIVKIKGGVLQQKYFIGGQNPEGKSISNNERSIFGSEGRDKSTGGRLFGGTNSRNAPGTKGKTAVLKGAAAAMYGPAPKRSVP